MREHTALHRARAQEAPAAPRPLGVHRLDIAAGFLFVVSFAVLLLCMDREVGPYDEGIVLFGAARVAAGDVPHRDFYANYGPGQFYVLAFLFELFSPSVLVERVWDAATRSASVVLVFLIAARAAARPAAWLAALASLAWLASLGSHGYPVFPALAAALASLLCLMPVFAGARSAPRLLGAGACVGLTALFRYDAGFFVFVAEGSVLAACALSRARRSGQGWRDLVRVAAPFCAGLGMVALPVAAAYAAAGALGGFAFDVVSFPSQHYARTRSLPFPVRSALRMKPPAISVYLPPLACAAAVPAVLAFARRRGGGDGPDGRFWTLLALVALTLAFFPKASSA